VASIPFLDLEGNIQYCQDEINGAEAANDAESADHWRLEMLTYQVERSGRLAGMSFESLEHLYLSLASDYQDAQEDHEDGADFFSGSLIAIMTEMTQRVVDGWPLLDDEDKVAIIGWAKESRPELLDLVSDYPDASTKVDALALLAAGKWGVALPASMRN
jgi:hypothetical protein